MTDQPPPGNYPPPPPGGYPPPPDQGGQQGHPPQGGQPGYPPQQGYPPPPPPGGYPPPPQSGYPPPGAGYQPPGTGYPGAGYPGAGYPPGGDPDGPGVPYSVGAAVGWAWNKFSKNAGPFILATLIFGVILLALNALVQLVAAALSPTEYTGVSSDDGLAFAMTADVSGMGLVALIIGLIVMVIVGAWVQSAFYCAVFRVADGEQVTLNSFFHPRNVANVVIASLLISIAVSLAYLVCLLPGLLVGSDVLFILGVFVGLVIALAVTVLLMFTIVALLERNLSPVDAIKTSYEVVKANFGVVFLTWLVTVAFSFVGSLLCLVGLLVAYPMIALITVYAFRRLTGGRVAPRTP